jgi:hypothetical protein
MIEKYLLTIQSFDMILYDTMNFNYNKWMSTLGRNMIQHRISVAIKKIETIEDSVQFFSTQKKTEEENLTNLIATYMQKCTSEEDKEGIDSLIRYLYWYTDISVRKIGSYVDLSKSMIANRAGYLIFSAPCARCQTVFASKKTSRTDTGNSLCSNCESQDILDSHKAFLEDWMDSTWVKHQNPKMDKGTYSAYLHSKHWKKTRGEALQRAAYKCQACSSKNEILDVHHNSYDRLGHEDPSDLIVLCRPCHARVHQK